MFQPRGMGDCTDPFSSHPSDRNWDVGLYQAAKKNVSSLKADCHTPIQNGINFRRQDSNGRSETKKIIKTQVLGTHLTFFDAQRHEKKKTCYHKDYNLNTKVSFTKVTSFWNYGYLHQERGKILKFQELTLWHGEWSHGLWCPHPMQASVPLLAVLPSVILHANGLGKAVEGGQSAWLPAPMWDLEKDCGSSVFQSQSLRPSWKWISGWKASLPLPLKLFQIK